MSRTVVMIHGMFSRPWVWEHYVPRFEARGWRCLTPVLRHHDHEPSEPAPEALGATSVLDYADDLEAAIRELPEAPVVVGHSMGGLLAQMLAARGVASAAVLLTPAAPAGIVGISPAVIRSFAGILLTPGFWKKPVVPSWRAARYGLLNGFPDEAESREVYRRLVHESGRAVFEIGLWPLDRRRAARVDAAAVRCPVLVIGAEHDRATPPGVVRRIARRYRGAEHHEIAGAAHWVLAQPGWEAVADLVLDWLERTVPDSPAPAAGHPGRGD